MSDRTKVNTPVPYSSVGDGERVVLFVHGFLDAGSVWDGVIAALKAPNLQKVTLDLPGMGALSDDAESISLERYAAEVGAVVTAIGKPAVIVAQSMGAQVAELVASRHPDRITGLVPVAPVPLGGLKAPATTIDPFKRLGGRPEAQRRQRRQLSPGLTAEDLERLGRLGDAVGPLTVAHLVDTWNDGHVEGEAASKFAGPVLVVRGKDDPFVTETMASGVASRFKNALVATVERAGHWAHVEQPQAVAELIESFLADIGWLPSAGVASAAAANDWRSAFAQKSKTAFADSFADDVVLEASVLNVPVRGSDNVKRVMAAASTLYESLVFTDQASDGSRQYLEWTAKAFGGVEMMGVTILNRNDAGLIQSIAIHHRPLPALMQFSVRLGQSLHGELDAAHFFPAEPRD